MEPTTLDGTVHQMHFKMVQFDIKNTKSGVGEYHICNLRTTHSFVLKALAMAGKKWATLPIGGQEILSFRGKT